MSKALAASLRTVILADAVMGAVVGTLVCAASGPLSAYTDLPPALLFWAGLSLLPIAGLLYWVAQRGVESPKAVASVVVGNGIWFLASLAIVLSEKVSMNGLGEAFVLGQGLVVLGFALLEARVARPLFAGPGLSAVR